MKSNDIVQRTIGKIKKSQPVFQWVEDFLDTYRLTPEVRKELKEDIFAQIARFPAEEAKGCSQQRYSHIVMSLTSDAIRIDLGRIARQMYLRHGMGWYIAISNGVYYGRYSAEMGGEQFMAYMGFYATAHRQGHTLMWVDVEMLCWQAKHHLAI